jgi:hypothetical protein
MRKLRRNEMMKCVDVRELVEMGMMKEEMFVSEGMYLIECYSRGVYVVKMVELSDVRGVKDRSFEDCYGIECWSDEVNDDYVKRYFYVVRD